MQALNEHRHISNNKIAKATFMRIRMKNNNFTVNFPYLSIDSE